MNPNPSLDSELLARYLTGEADDAQRRAVEDWCAAAPENARELERMRVVWDLGGEASSAEGPDVDRAWHRLRMRIAEEDGRGRVRPIGGAPLGLWRWMAAAAVIAGLVFAARWFTRPGPIEHLARAEAVQVLLADSSRCVLAPGARIEERMGARREVRLQGRAYFEVRRDAQRPFTVEAGELDVTVLGTAFEVTAHDTSALLTVRVRSGRVRVEAGGDRLELGAREHAVYHRERHVLERRPAPPAESWGLRVLHFENATLAQVVAHLERSHGVRIMLMNDRVAACRLTAEFDDEPIDSILEVIAGTFGLEAQRTADGSYFLQGDGC